LNQFELVVVPEGSELPEHLAGQAERMREEGKIISWTGVDELRSRITPLVSLRNSENIWTLPRKIPGDTDSPLVIHLLNQDYDEEGDRMMVKSGVEIFLSERLMDGRSPNKVTAFTPGSDPQELEISHEGQGVVVTLPELNLWAILKIE